MAIPMTSVTPNNMASNNMASNNMGSTGLGSAGMSSNNMASSGMRSGMGPGVGSGMGSGVGSGMVSPSMNIREPSRDSIFSLASKGSAGKTESSTPPLLPGARNQSPSRGHLLAGLGEFVGTFLFLFFAFAGTQVANNSIDTSTTATLVYIALSFGFSLAVTAWVFYRITGGAFNPAVTLALFLVGCLSWTRALIIFIAQILGAICAAAVVSALFPGPASFTTQLSANTSVTRGLFIEMFLTFMLIFTILMLAVEKHRATFLAPIGIGLSLFVAELAGVAYTGGSLNPARSFGPAVARRRFPGHHWIYWLGPLLGAILAVLFYRFIRALEYETYGAAGQDSDRVTSPTTNNNDVFPSRVVPVRTSREPFASGPSTEAQRRVL